MILPGLKIVAFNSIEIPSRQKQTRMILGVTMNAVLKNIIIRWMVEINNSLVLKKISDAGEQFHMLKNNYIISKFCVC